MSNHKLSISINPTDESRENVLITIKEGRADFVAHVLNISDDWVKEKFGAQAEACVRNTPDGMYEVYTILKLKP